MYKKSNDDELLHCESCSNEGCFDEFADPNVSKYKRISMKQELNSNTTGRVCHRLTPNFAHIQYFLASLCDSSASSKRPNGTFARCYLVEEVQDILNKLKQSQFVNAQSYKVNVIVTVLKELFQSVPNGLFGKMEEEFFKISLESSLQITIMYLHSIVHELPNTVYLVSFLLFKALKNVIRLSANENGLKTYTDLVMHFTPVLFPAALGDVDIFLIAARLLLVLVDYNEQIFDPSLPIGSNDNVCEEECFFNNILTSLQNLEATLACDDSGVESEPEEESLPMSISSTPCELSSKWSSGYNGSTSSMDVSLEIGTRLPSSFYHFTYIESDDQMSPEVECFVTLL